MFLTKVFHHAPHDTECQRADAERGERAHQKVGGRVGQCEAGAEGHIRREAHGALRHEREKHAREDQADNLSDTSQPRALLMRIVTGAWLRLTAVRRVHAFASPDWQPQITLEP